MVRRLGVLLGLLLLTACAGVLYPAERQFLPAQQDFAERLRWLDIAGAARHFEPELEEDFRDRFAALPGLHITDVRIEAADFLPEAQRMMTTSVIEYYQLPSTTVRTWRLRQEWEYAGGDRFQTGVWRIITPFPELPTTPRRE